MIRGACLFSKSYEQHILDIASEREEISSLHPHINNGFEHVKRAAAALEAGEE